MNWLQKAQDYRQKLWVLCFLLYKLCSGVSMLVTEKGQMWKFRDRVKSPDWSLLVMRAIRGRLFKGTCSRVLNHRSHLWKTLTLHFYQCVLKTPLQYSGYLETPMGFQVESYHLSHAFFPSWRKVLVGISWAHVYSVHGAPGRWFGRCEAASSCCTANFQERTGTCFPLIKECFF